MNCPSLAQLSFSAWAILTVFILGLFCWCWEQFQRRRPIKIIPPNKRTAADWCGGFRDEVWDRNEKWETEALQTFDALTKASNESYSVHERAISALCAEYREKARCLAAIRLSVDGSQDAESALIVALQDNSEWVRRCAAIALVKLGQVRGLAAVVAGTRHGKGIRTRAAHLLSAFGAQAIDAIPALISLLRYRPIGNVSHMAASDALAAIGAPAIPALSVLKDSTCENERFYAETTLAQIREKLAVEASSQSSSHRPPSH